MLVISFLCIALCVSAVQSVFAFLLVSLCLCGKNGITFAHSAKCSLTSAMQRPNWQRRWLHGSFPPFCVISAPRSLTPADIKCQFSGCTGASRPPFQRENVQIVQNLQLIYSNNTFLNDCSCVCPTITGILNFTSASRP